MTTPSIIDAMADDALFASWFQGDTWNGWRVILKAAYALRMTDDEREFFKSVAERDPPQRPVKELWIIAGRRAGKDSVASVVAAHSAAMFQDQRRLRPGERALVLCLAVDRDQAKIVLNYTRSYFTDIDLLRGMVTRETATGLELSNCVDLTVATNNFRSVRGRAILVVILDEVAFYRDESSASPDVEVYNALTPGLASLSPGSMLIGISSPYARTGLLYKKYKDHYGKDSPDILVVKGGTRQFNPTIDQAIIDQAMTDDPAAARAEWLGEFRDDIESFVSREVVEAAVVPGRIELPPASGITYVCAVDPAGGSGSDSFTCAVAHRSEYTERIVIDAVREWRPRFSPDQVCKDIAALCRTYRINKLVGDHWGGEFVREPLRDLGLQYALSDRPKSAIYTDALALLNSGRVELPDNARLISQLCGLERKTSRGGRDSVDHTLGGHDDISNSVLLAALLANRDGGRPRISAVGVEMYPRTSHIPPPWLA